MVTQRGGLTRAREPIVVPRRPGRLVRQVALGALAVVALGVVVVYHRQIWSFATHWQGGPEQTWDPAPLPGEPLLRVAAMGDVGDGADDFHATATQVYELGRDRGFDVVYLLGDNIYPRGDPDGLEARVLEPLRAVLDTGAELRAVLGNHDVMLGRGDEQLELLGMPGRWHAVERGGVLLVGLDTEDDDPAQAAWLDATLAGSEAPWRVVAMHRPPYSAGYQGSDLAARERYGSILRRHGVQLVLSGHDHDYQRSVPIGPTTFVVSGGGSSTRRTGSSDLTAVSFAVQHFVDIAVYPDRLLLRAVDDDGGVFDEVAIARDGAVTELRAWQPREERPEPLARSARS